MTSILALLLAKACWLALGGGAALYVAPRVADAQHLAGPPWHVTHAFVFVAGIVVFWPLLFAVRLDGDRR